jgi:hypothetical protein
LGYIWCFALQKAIYLLKYLIIIGIIRVSASRHLLPLCGPGYCWASLNLGVSQINMHEWELSVKHASSISSDCKPSLRAEEIVDAFKTGRKTKE